MPRLPPIRLAASNISWSVRAETPRSTSAAALSSRSIERIGDHRRGEAGPVCGPASFGQSPISSRSPMEWINERQAKFGHVGIVALAAVLNVWTTPLHRTKHRREDPGLRRLPWRGRQTGRHDDSHHLGATGGLYLYRAARFQAGRPQERHHATDRYVDGTPGICRYRGLFLEKAMAGSGPASCAKEIVDRAWTSTARWAAPPAISSIFKATARCLVWRAWAGIYLEKQMTDFRTRTRGNNPGMSDLCLPSLLTTSRRWRSFWRVCEPLRPRRLGRGHPLAQGGVSRSRSDDSTVRSAARFRPCP